jgi:hypothetical protein
MQCAIGQPSRAKKFGTLGNEKQCNFFRKFSLTSPLKFVAVALQTVTRTSSILRKHSLDVLQFSRALQTAPQSRYFYGISAIAVCVTWSKVVTDLAFAW